MLFLRKSTQNTWKLTLQIVKDATSSSCAQLLVVNASGGDNSPIRDNVFAPKIVITDVFYFGHPNFLILEKRLPTNVFKF